MRILYISPFPSRPLYGGSVVRNHHLGLALARRHEVWASFCGIDGDACWTGEVPLKGPGRQALFDPGFLLRARRAIKQNAVEAIVCSSLIAGLHGRLLKMLTGLPFWMDEHNVEWHCSRRYGFKAWPLVWLLEAFVLRGADQVTCVSGGDRDRLIANFRLDPDRVRVAPNGVDIKALREGAADVVTSGDRKRRRILFFGVLDYPPNREAVQALGEEIAPLAPEDIDFLVAGVGGEDLARRYPRLRHQGFVDDIHALVRSCDGVIVPLKSGGGTRMKILEAVACGCPVASTSLGAEGLDRQVLGPALTIADTTVEMLAWLDSVRIGSRAEAGSGFEETYDWAAIWHRTAPL